MSRKPVISLLLLGCSLCRAAKGLIHVAVCDADQQGRISEHLEGEEEHLVLTFGELAENHKASLSDHYGTDVRELAVDQDLRLGLLELDLLFLERHFEIAFGLLNADLLVGFGLLDCNLTRLGFLLGFNDHRGRLYVSEAELHDRDWHFLQPFTYGLLDLLADRIPPLHHPLDTVPGDDCPRCFSNDRLSIGQIDLVHADDADTVAVLQRFCWNSREDLLDVLFIA